MNINVHHRPQLFREQARTQEYRTLQLKTRLLAASLTVVFLQHFLGIA